MAIETKKSYCRICTACCAIEVDIEDNRVIKVRGDASDPVSGGYSCIKGRSMPYQAHSEKRLTSSLKRLSDGSYQPISSEQAMNEIAERLQQIIDKYGKRAVASFCGTAAYNNCVSVPFVQAWHRGLGSPSHYSTMTLDQPAKIVAVGRIGTWGGGAHSFSSADVVMCIGYNPLVSGLSMFGAPPGVNPYKNIRDAKKRGLKVICIDPRRTELADFADIHLQVRPGEDPTLLAGILRVVFEEELYDKDFCRDHVAGIAELRAAVNDFTPDYVQQRADVPAKQMIEAARLFAKGPRGYVSSGTGPDFAPHNCLAEHLIASVNIVCGRFNKEGDKLTTPGVLMENLPRPAQAISPEFLPPMFSIGKGPASRLHGLHQVCGEMPSSILSDEILEPGEGQIRALITSCANPAVSMPDQRKMIRALDSLELSVCVELEMSATARHCDYIIASRHALEREDVTEFMDMFYEVPYAFYTEAVIQPENDYIEDWELFIGLAKRLNFSIELPCGTIDPGKTPAKFDVIKMLKPNPRISLEEVRSIGRGHIFDQLDVYVDAPIPGMEARLQLAPEGICEEIAEVFSKVVDSKQCAQSGAAFSHILISRRLSHVINSYGQTYPEIRKKGTTNYAYMNEADLKQLGIADEDLIEIESDHGTIIGVVQSTDEVKSGVISMSHCWGDTPDSKLDVREFGVNTNLLIKTDKDFEPITGLARLSAIPVAVRPHV